MVKIMNRQSSMMKDMVSIIKVGCGVVWDCVVDTSTQVYRVFKRNDVQNDNKSHMKRHHVNTSNVNKSKLNHGINPMQDPNGLSRLTTGSYTNDYTKAGCSTPGNVKNSSYDSNQNENNTNVQDENEVDSKGIEDEDDWRDRFTGWLP